MFLVTLFHEMHLVKRIYKKMILVLNKILFIDVIPFNNKKSEKIQTLEI